MSAPRWKVSSGPVGPKLVEVLGHDVTGAVEALQVVQRDGEAPRLRLELRPEASFEVEGDGVVEVLRDGMNVAEFLRGISPDALEAEVLARMEWGDEPTFRLALNVLADWADGKVD